MVNRNGKFDDDNDDDDKNFRRCFDKLKTAVAHSDEKYQCKEMVSCPFIGTTIVQRTKWLHHAGEDQANVSLETPANKEFIIYDIPTTVPTGSAGRGQR